VEDDPATFAQQAAPAFRALMTGGLLNGIFFTLRSGMPCDLPERYGPYTTVYNRFNRWRRRVCGTD